MTEEDYILKAKQSAKRQRIQQGSPEYDSYISEFVRLMKRFAGMYKKKPGDLFDDLRSVEEAAEYSALKYYKMSTWQRWTYGVLCTLPLLSLCCVIAWLFFAGGWFVIAALIWVLWFSWNCACNGDARK